MKKILVIGASGFVGQHVAHALLTAGYVVRGLARNLAKMQALAAAGVEVMQGDLLDSASMQRAAGPDRRQGRLHRRAPTLTTARQQDSSHQFGPF